MARSRLIKLTSSKELKVEKIHSESRHEKRGPKAPRAGDSRPQRRPPVSGALLSHGLTPQYHRRSAA